MDCLDGKVRSVTALSYQRRINILGKLGDLDNTEQIKKVICAYPCSESRKELLSDAYDYYVQYKGLTWTKPKFTREDKPILLPLENELNQLISNMTYKLSVFLQLLKETGMDSGEAWKLRWIDLGNKTVNVTSTKNHNARTLNISENLMARLMKLPRANERVFANKNLDDFRTNYEQNRNRLSDKLGNPRLRQIAFKSFRHWFATMQYHRTRDILHVKYLLGHKRLENTLIYTHLVNFESDDHTSAVAKSVDEASKLVESGFEYITTFDNIMLFRKRK